MGCGGGFMVVCMGALRWNSGDARPCSGNMERSPRAFADSEMTSGTWRQPRLIAGRAVETCAGQVLRPPAEIQARIRRCRVFGCRDLKVCPRADQENLWGLEVMFHVKQFLFLPVFHVERSCYSVRQAAARPISPLRCHSERSEESPNFKANPISTCGDSSSQAPQNDNEKWNAGVSRPKSRLFHVKHHSDPLHIVPFPMRD